MPTHSITFDPQPGTPDTLTRVLTRLHNEIANGVTVFTGYPPDLAEYIRLAANNAETTFGKFRTRLTLPSIKCGSNVLVSCGGGKDGFAAAVLLQRAALNPVIFHVHGLNRAYPKEIDAVQETSALLGFPSVYRAVRNVGKTRFMSSPVRDQMILAAMVDYASVSGINNFSMGLETKNPLAESNHLVNWSDASEMVAAGNAWFNSTYPGFRWHCPLEYHSQSYQVLVEHNPKTLRTIQSCVMPVRFQGMRKKSTEKEYGVTLLPNRCGVCQKCAVEYLHLVCLGEMKKHTRYVERCVEIYRQKTFEVYGVEHFKDWTRDALIRKCIDERYVDPAPVLGRIRLKV